MPRYLVRLRRDRRQNQDQSQSAKSLLDAVRQFPDVSVEQVHSADMATVETSEATAQKLKDAIGDDYHVEPEIRRSLH